MVLVAPTGGVIYVLAERYATLLLSWRFYAGVTATQVVLMTIPCLVLRLVGFGSCGGVERLIDDEAATALRSAPVHHAEDSLPMGDLVWEGQQVSRKTLRAMPLANTRPPPTAR